MSSSPPASSALASVTLEEVQISLLRELFVRNREETLVGLIPILLLVWSHYHAHPLPTLLLWGGCLVAVQLCRWAIAHRFLQHDPASQATRRAAYRRYEWLGVVALAAGWVSSIAVLDTGLMDTLFYLRLIFLIGLVTFLLSSIGIDLRLYASFLVVVVSGTLAALYVQHPAFLRDYPVISYGFAVYAGMLLVRSRGEFKRTHDWLTARLNRKRLLDQLNNTLTEERLMRDQLRLQSQELEARNRELNELAVRDGLTRAFRRGHVEAELRRMIKGLQRHHDDFSMLMMDIDLFKRVNDQYGHAVGDEVLRRLASQVQGSLRAGDLFGRWGGEEFIVLMPQTPLASAVDAAQRLRTGVAALQFTTEGTQFQITISIGVAQLQPEEDADTLVARADEALYAAKHAGRDRVMAAPALTAG